MRVMSWFKSTLATLFQVDIKPDQIGSEGTVLDKDEIDHSIIPMEWLEELPQSLLFETVIYQDKDRSEWIGIIAMDVGTRKWFVQAILKDGRVMYRNRCETS